MKLTTELKVLLAVGVVIAVYLLFRKAKQASSTVSDAAQNFASNFDANTAPVGGISLNDAIGSGTIPNPVTDAPWWAQTADALGFTIPYSWWATPSNTGGATGTW